MGKISSYSYDLSPSLSDYVLGNSATGPVTQRFTLQAILSLLSSSTAISSQIQSYSPSWGTVTNVTIQTSNGYYVSVGGLKLAWGQIGYTFTSSNTTGIISTIGLPSSFFTTIYTFLPGIYSVGGTLNQHATGGGAQAGASAYVNINLDGGSGNGTGGIATWFVIGS